MWLVMYFLISSKVLQARVVFYEFKYNYDVKVTDSTAYQCHGEKPAIGSPTAVNTPYGLYLDGGIVKLPPNTQNAASCNDLLTYYNYYSITMFVRYLPGTAGTYPRELFTIARGSSIRMQLRQRTQLDSVAPEWEVESYFGTTTTVTGYALSES
jgi:hypothetical protein